MGPFSHLSQRRAIAEYNSVRHLPAIRNIAQSAILKNVFRFGAPETRRALLRNINAIWPHSSLRTSRGRQRHILCARYPLRRVRLLVALRRLIRIISPSCIHQPASPLLMWACSGVSFFLFGITPNCDNGRGCCKCEK